MRPERGNLIFILLFLVALATRLIAWKQNYVIAPDGTFYIRMAQLISDGNYNHEFFRFHEHYAFFPLLIVAFQRVFSDWILAGQMVAVFCGTLTVIPLYLLARRVFDERVALLTAVFYIVCPDLVQHSAEVLRDTPSVFFYMMALWVGYEAVKQRRFLLAVLSGLLIALSASLRVEGLVVFVPLTVFLFWHARKNSIPWRRPVVLVLGLLAGVMSLLVVLGVVATARGINISARQFATARSAFLSSRVVIEGIDTEVAAADLSPNTRNFFNLAREHRFVLYLSHIVHKTAKVFNILFVLLLFGLIKRRAMTYHEDELLLLFLGLVWIGVFLVYVNVSNYLSTRHPFLIVVPFLIWSSVGFVEIKERLVQWITRRRYVLREAILRWATPVLLLVICVPLLAAAWAPQRRDKLELKEIGLWLKDHGYDHTTIAAQGEFARLVFYAEGVFVPLSGGNYGEVLSSLRESGASLLVVNRNTIEGIVPRFFEAASVKDLQQIGIPGIKTPKYGTTVFRVEPGGD